MNDKKTRPEFGNIEHIAMLKREKKEKEEEERLLKIVKRGKVGVKYAEICGNCEVPVYEGSFKRVINGKSYRFCDECDSCID